MSGSSESDQNGHSNEDKTSNSISKAGDNKTCGSADSGLSPPSKLKDCTKFSSQFCLAKMVKLIRRLTDRQKDIIRDCGFGTILLLKCTSVPNTLILWLAKHYDPTNRHFKSDGGSYFKIDAITVHQILGIPFGGKKVPNKSSSHAKSVILKDTNQQNQAAKIDDLVTMITRDLVGDKFARIFFLIALGIFLCPKSSATVSHQFYVSICTVKEIRSYDWCTAVSECLHLGLMNFQTNARKGNSSGKATLGGCLFVLVMSIKLFFLFFFLTVFIYFFSTLSNVCIYIFFSTQAAYFDYLVMDHVSIEQTVPRICVWDDITICSHSEAESALKHIQFKRMDETLFTKEKMDPSAQRGFNLPDASDRQHEGGIHAVSSISNQQDTTHTIYQEQEVYHLSTPPAKAAVQSESIDFESARKVLPSASELSLRVLCGEVTHPDVESFIRSTIGAEAPAEAIQQLNTMCQGFFKESIQQYVKSIEPVVVNQCCDMVKSFWTGLQQAKTQGHDLTKEETVPVLSETRTTVSDSPNVNQFQSPPKTQNKSDFPKDHSPSNTASLKISSHTKETKCPASASEDGLCHGQTRSDIVMKSQMTMSTSPASKLINDVVADLMPTESSHVDVFSAEISSPAIKKDGTPLIVENRSYSDPANSPVGSDGKRNHSTSMPASTDAIKDASNSPVGSSCSQLEIHPGIQSPAKSKRNTLTDDQVVNTLQESPMKKQKPDSNIASVHCAPRDPSTVGEAIGGSTNDSAPGTSESPVVDNINKNRTGKDLSDMGHKKRAVKAPASLFKGEKVKAPRIVLSDLEKQVYHLGTKRIRDTDSNPDCVRIGRMSITLREFGDTMRPKKWVGTFAMNVYTEALMFDEAKHPNPKCIKGFLTSAEVDHMKVNDIDIELLKRKLHHATINFHLNKVDMVMLPVLHGGHWWLVVANIRDNRFDVLSSTKFTDEMKSVTAVVRVNFERVFKALYSADVSIDITDFTTAYQDAPQQSTTFDCGIFVMNFMSSWVAGGYQHLIMNKSTITELRQLSTCCAMRVMSPCFQASRNS